MKNTKLYPFERNRYYSGKMLTSSDFQAEQTYFNNKRRFINNLMYGSGIVCGCGVFNLDDLSLLVESGVAIDGLGREIVLESSVVKKLSAVEGFDHIKSNLVSLCLRYKEEPVHTVYTLNQGASDDGREYEYNRISEGYQIFVMDRLDDSLQIQMETEFLSKTVLVDNDDFTVRLIMPTSVCKGRNVKFVLQAEKKSEENKHLTFHGMLQVPSFLTPDGGHEINIDLEDVTLKAGEAVQKDYWLFTENVPAEDTTILLKGDTVKAYVDNMAVAAAPGCSIKVLLTNNRPKALISKEIGRMSLEMKTLGAVKDYIVLADLKLVRTESAYIIEEVIEKDVKQYITPPADEMLRSEFLEYFVKDVDLLNSASMAEAPMSQMMAPVAEGRVPEVATGILEIPLGDNARRGDIRYSGEIMHGLGKGNVYVDIGYEYIRDDRTLQSSAKNTIYGNPDLFKEDKTAVNAETAVKVLNDKGSFVVAAKLLENVDYLVLTYRWVAIKFPAGNDLEIEADAGNMSISADTPTVVLGTKDSHYFHVKFNHMESCSIAYELTEPGSGEITADGVYTAPAKEGVYEIRIYCVDMPIICTYAYAIVKKKGFEESAS